MDCIVLAGGVPRPGQPLHRVSQGLAKAVVELAGRPMVEHVLAALEGAELIDRVVLVGVGPEDGIALPERVKTIPRQGSIVDNLYAGIAALESDAVAAYCWSDIPLVQAEMIDRFIEQSSDPEADVSAGLVSRELLLSRYPRAQQQWLKLREGYFIAADFGTFRPASAPSVRQHLDSLTRLRKSALRQAAAVGVPVLLRYLAGRLSIEGLERHLRRRYGLRCRIRAVSDPELGMDVDTRADLELCRSVLGRAVAKA